MNPGLGVWGSANAPDVQRLDGTLPPFPLAPKSGSPSVGVRACMPECAVWVIAAGGYHGPDVPDLLPVCLHFPFWP